MANRATVFGKIKDLHYKMGNASPQILVSVLMRELAIDLEEAQKHLDGLQTLQLIKYKGTAKMAVELTKSGLTTNMKITPVAPVEGSNPE